MLETRSLSYSIRNRSIVQDITLRLNTGEVMAIVGPNGAGKSTLLKLLSGDLAPTGGDILVDGIPLKRYPARELALKRAVMTQSALVSFEFTAFEVALMGRYPHQRFGVPDGRDHREIVHEAMRRTETDDLAERLYPTLSSGESSRVTLARVLAQETPLLLLDEPTATLDLRHQQLVMKTARELAQGGAGIITIVHDLNLAAAYADRVTMLHLGQLFATGTPHEVLTDENIQTVFNLPVLVMQHPAPNERGDCPLIIPLEPGTK